MTVSPGSPPDDATLAVAAGAGNVAALGAIYDRYAGRLLGFSQSMLRSRAEAEDCLQDVFVIAATRLRNLRQPELLRPWLFAVARHECLARLDKRKKEVLMNEVPDRTINIPPPPVTGTGDRELAALLEAASAGLSDRDRLLLELADRQQLSGDELARAVGVPRSTAYTLVARARATARKSLGALLVARTGRSQCAALDAQLGGWDGTLTTLRRKQISRHIDGCSTCTAHRDRVATPAALVGDLFADSQAFAARLIAMRSRILTNAVAAGQSPVAPPQWKDGWPPSDPNLLGRRRLRRPLSVAGTVALVLVAVVVSLAVFATPSGERDSTRLVTAGTPSSPSAPTQPAATTTAPTTTPPSIVPTATATTRPAPTHPTPTTTSFAPQINFFTVDSPHTCVQGNASGVTPVVSWSTSHATGVALSIDNPAIVGAYGNYGPSGSLTPTFIGCDSAPGTVITHYYDLWTRGGTGAAAHQRVVLHITVTAAPTTGGGSTTTAPPSPPTINLFSVSAPSTCVQGNASTVDPVISWSTSNATGVALSIDNPSIQGAFGDYGPSGSISPTSIGCDSAPGTVITHHYDLWTRGGTGAQAHRSAVLNITVVAPPSSPST